MDKAPDMDDSLEQRLFVLTDIRDYLFWQGADLKEEEGEVQNIFQMWVSYLDKEIELMEWFIRNIIEKENDDE